MEIKLLNKETQNDYLYTEAATVIELFLVVKNVLCLTLYFIFMHRSYRSKYLLVSLFSSMIPPERGKIIYLRKFCQFI